MPIVLVVDDRAINRDFLAALLRHAGYETIESANGSEALERIRRQRPDLVITDLLMPVMDGVELATVLRADPETHGIPVVFHSATYPVAETRELARDCGVEFVLPKPSNPKLILDVVEQIIGPGNAEPGRNEMTAALARENPVTSLVHRVRERTNATRHDRSKILAVANAAPPYEASPEIYALSLRLAALLDLGLKIGSERERQGLLELFCRTARDFVACDYVGVIMTDADQEAVADWAAAGLDDTARADLAHTVLTRGAFADALGSQDPISFALVGGTDQSGGLPPSHPQVDTLMLAPVHSWGARGVLYFAGKRGGALFDSEDQQIAAMLSAQLAASYGALAMFEESQRHAGVLRFEGIERERVARTLRESEQRFRELAQNIREVFFLDDLDTGKTLYVSPAYEEVWGKSCQSLYVNPADWLQSVHPDDRARLQYQDRTKRYLSEYRIIRPDGTQRSIRSRGFPIVDDSGRAYRLAGVAEDVTEHTEARDRLRESDRRFSALLADVSLLTVMLDCECRVIYCNPSLLQATGWTSEEVVGSGWVERFIPPERWAIFRDRFSRFLVSPHSPHIENEILTRSGDLRTVRWNNTVLRASSGAVIGSASIGEDITEARRTQAALVDSEARYHHLFDSSPQPMWVFELGTLRFLAVNAAALEHYGYSREEFLAMTLADIRPPCDVEAMRRSVAADNDGLDRAGVWRHFKRDGSQISVEITAHRIDFEGQPAQIVLANDVTARVEQERKVARLSRIRAVIGGISSAMLRSQDGNDLLHEACRIATNEGVFPLAWASTVQPGAESRMVAIEGDPAAVEQLRAFADMESIPPAVRPSVRAIRARATIVTNDLAHSHLPPEVIEELKRFGFHSYTALPLYVHHQPVAAIVLLASEPGFFDPDEITLLEWMARDLSFALERIADSERLTHLGYFDALTELPNSALFNDRLSQFVLAAKQDSLKVAVVVLDLKRFTSINDTLGREAGDELLRLVGARLKAFMVEPFTLGRIGSDTFAIASPRDPENAATHLRDSVFEALGAPFTLAGRHVRVGAQAGIAIFPTDGADGKEVFRNAEAALQLAKSSGQPYAYHSREISAQLAQRAALEGELRGALKTRQFVVHYQPRVDLSSGELIGAEALVRWQHPGAGLVPPSRFIALAEETGFINALGTWVIDSVCAQQAAWAAAGVATVPIAVNLSSVQLETDALLHVVRQALARNGLDPRDLNLELTESAVMKDPFSATRTLQALRAMGVRLALDDFGTGYASLAYFKRFPFHSVKIDRSFVTDITSNAEDAAIAAAIITMSHRLGLTVVAEGVETEAQFRYLRAQGCDEMQGYFFSPAIAADAFEMLLRSGRRLTLPDAPSSKPILLVVDDESSVRSALSRLLRRDGYEVLTAGSGAEGLELLALNPVQVIISGQRMERMSGTAFLETAKHLHPDTVRIILSGYTDLEAVTDAVNRGSVFKFLTKPWDDEQLREQVRDAFRRYRPAA